MVPKSISAATKHFWSKMIFEQQNQKKFLEKKNFQKKILEKQIWDKKKFLKFFFHFK